MRPPSPSGRASAIVATSLTWPPGLILSTRAESRSVTSASPPGRNARPHGTDRPLATVRVPGGGALSAVVVEHPASMSTSTKISLSFPMPSILTSGS